VERISPRAEQLLLAHRWPGNVRELSNVIERAVIFAQGEEIGPSELPEHFSVTSHERRPAVPPHPGSHVSIPLGTPLKEVEELLIRKTLEATSGDKRMTAKLLGINSRTIYRKLPNDQK
jgi:two-component system response regulator HydG